MFRFLCYFAWGWLLLEVVDLLVDLTFTDLVDCRFILDCLVV